jgi:diguanylate cyclase (GGDEF)-like protein
MSGQLLLGMGLAALPCVSAVVWLAWKQRGAGRANYASAYGLAADMAAEGLFVFSPATSHPGAIADWTVVHCNARGAGYFGMEQAELIGKALSELYSGVALESVLNAFAQAGSSGRYEDEREDPVGSPLGAMWLRRQIVRSGDYLAVAFKDISSEKADALEKTRLENEDPVTLLPNRKWLIDYLDKRFHDSSARTGLLFIDLDDFKNINDSLGHPIGDLLLRSTAARLKSVVGVNDRVVRLGGDEFAVVLPEVCSHGEASRIADLILEIVRFPLQLSMGRESITASIGISMFPDDGADTDTLLKSGEIAMYAAKDSGKAQHRIYDTSLYQRLKSRLSLEHDLAEAIEKDQFVLYFEPRMHVDSGRYSGLEALVRWLHPERGLVPPLEFIPLAESTGLIVKLGDLIIDKAFRQILFWQATGCPAVPVSINISARQFNNGDLGKSFFKAFEKYGVPPSLVEIELTESAMLGDQASIGREIAAMRALGIRVLIDDFGTGYSSLSQLRRLKMDTLKIDRTFLSELDQTSEGEIFVKAIISMAHALGMTVVAEGVEREAQLLILQSLSCDEVQGYYLSPPMPAYAVPDFLADVEAYKERDSVA